MPTHILRAAGAAALVVLCCATAPAVAGASKPGDLRIVDSDGATLAEHTQYTGKVRIKARAKADCFGEGTGGSGKRVKVPGATALGLAADGSRWDRDIRPLLVTDAFDFGLGVCGFGKAVAPSTGFWYLKVNHAGSQVGGDQARLKRGDDVLWYLIEDFNRPTPSELVLKAPNRVAGEKVAVRVWEYGDDGGRKPAVGATVNGGDAPTGADGRTTVTVDPPARGTETLELQASGLGAIPSNVTETCLAAKLGRCSKHHPTVIRGSNKREVIRGTRGDDDIAAGRGRDVVRAGAGDDVIDVRGGGRDVVHCGPGNDRVKADKRDRLRGCKSGRDRVRCGSKSRPDVDKRGRIRGCR
jgi:Ca2+-binding RTX toxin-like protein